MATHRGFDSPNLKPAHSCTKHQQSQVSQTQTADTHNSRDWWQHRGHSTQLRCMPLAPVMHSVIRRPHSLCVPYCFVAQPMVHVTWEPWHHIDV